MKSKKQKNNLRKSKIRYNQRYLQSGGTLIYIIYMGQLIEIDTNRINGLIHDSRITIADLKDNIYRWGLLPISLEQRFLMVISEDSIGECYDWVTLNDIIEHLGPNQRLQFTLTINPLAINTIDQMFNVDRFHFTALYSVNNGERNIILKAIIYELFNYYSRYISDLRKAIDGIVTPPEVSTRIPRRGEFKIYIQTLTNNFELMVLSTDTVYDIKLMIEKITEIRPHKARLLLPDCTLSDGRPVACQLEDGRDLASYNIRENRILRLLLHGSPSKCGCEKYTCQSCIMSQMTIGCKIDRILHPETEVNQHVIFRVSQQIRETQNEIIHLTRVLDVLRGQIPPTASGSSQLNPQLQQQSHVGPPSVPPPSHQQQSRVGPPSVPPPSHQPRVGPPSVPPPSHQSRVGPPPVPPPSHQSRVGPPSVPPPPHQQQSRVGPPSVPPPSHQQQSRVGLPPSTGEDRLIFEMGFDRDRVLQALQLTNNNEEEALNLIMSSYE